MNRYACIHDLNNYFKKRDLLGGLTESEQTQLRKNIGLEYLTGGGSEPVEIKYEALNDLVQRKALQAGIRYIITDFQTIYESNVENSVGNYITWGSTTNPSEVYHIVVAALTPEILSKKATILEHPEWTVEYDAAKETLSDGLTTKGKITYLRDSNNNVAFYDFKNVKFRRTREQIPSLKTTYGDFYTFSDVVNGEIVDSSSLHNTRCNVIKDTSWNNVFLGDTYNNRIETGCQNNTFVKGMCNTVLQWDSVNNICYEPVMYTTGSLYNQIFKQGNTVLSTSITKTIHKVNEATIVSFLDPITYAYQVIIL